MQEENPATTPESQPKENHLSALETVLRVVLESRHNTVTDKLEVKSKSDKTYSEITDRFVNSIWRHCNKNHQRISIEELRRILESNFTPLYNPFRHYLDNLPLWDGETDYIQQLADTVQTTNQNYWNKCFRKWLVAMVACMYEDRVINHTALILVGRQGLGKSTWIRKLVPSYLSNYYYSGLINPENKDTLIFLSECMLIHLDELESMNRRSVGSVKEMITKGEILVRKPFARYANHKPRRASFVGSVNTTDFLNDPTGSRRFLCVEATDIAFTHTVDIDCVFAQAIYLYLEEFPYFFDTQEEQEVVHENKQFTKPNVEDDYLSEHFAVCEEADATHVLTTSEVLRELSKLTQQEIPINNATLQQLGKALVRKEFKRVKRNGNQKYLLKSITRPRSFLDSIRG